MSFNLVIGGAGFIGSHFGERSRPPRPPCTGGRQLDYRKRKNLDHIPATEFLEGDLADAAVAQRAVEGVDYVLHQVVIPSGPRSVEDLITSQNRPTLALGGAGSGGQAGRG